VNLVLLDAAEAAADPVTLTGARARHLLTVLRVQPGHTVRVGIIDGPLGVGTVCATGVADVHLRCAFEPTAPPRPAVDLLLALPRPKVMRRLWAQLAAVGVGRIIVTNAERVERNYFDTHVLEPALYRPLLIEGLQQARDTHVPLVSIHRRFRVLIEDELHTLSPSAIRIVADPAATASVSAAIGAGDRRTGEDDVPGRVLIAVGPEGGWNDFERQLLADHGFRAAAMGARTLRTDTACIALLSLVHAALRS